MTDAMSTSPRSSSVAAKRPDWFQAYGIRHIALIPDGNRRWAKERSVPIEVGHAQGLLRVLPMLTHELCDAGVHTLTVWGFSTENWTRELPEVKYLMKMFTSFLRNQMLDIANRHDARVYHLGRRDRLYPEVIEAMEHVERQTANHGSHVLNIALDYGGRDELHRAGLRLLEAKRSAASDTELQLSDFLDTRGQPHPEPDIVIRSSGEQRLSGFLPMQTVYSELFFVEQMFPEFTFETIQKVAEQFRWRKRRFGS